MANFTPKKLILLVGDVLLLYVALYITLLIRYRAVSPELWQQHLIPFSLLFAIWIIVFFINNLYSIQSVRNDVTFYSYLVQNLLINLALGFIFFYLAPANLTSLSPFRVLFILILVFTILFLLWRNLFYISTSSKTFRNKVLFIGLNDEAIELIIKLQQQRQLGYTVAAILEPGMDIPESIRDIPYQKDVTTIRSLIEKYEINTVVTALDPHSKSDVSHYLFDTLNLGIQYTSFADFYESLTGRVPVASLEESWFLQNLLRGSKTWFAFFKRIQDILFSIVFGLLAVPFIPFIILGIKLTSPGPILFKQDRVGKGGKIFKAMKFRSMVTDAERNGPQWATKNDSRVTKFGKIMRKTRIDEIPQFINILKGDMSFVGPRPERPEFVSLLSNKIPFYKERLLVKPGLSGWAQINFKYGDSVDDALTKLQYDLFYIKNQSFALDISIVFKTINTVINASLGQ